MSDILTCKGLPAFPLSALITWYHTTNMAYENWVLIIFHPCLITFLLDPFFFSGIISHLPVLDQTIQAITALTLSIGKPIYNSEYLLRCPILISGLDHFSAFKPQL